MHLGGRDLMDSDYYCCHGEDVSRCLATLRRHGKHTHACVTHIPTQTLHLCEIQQNKYVMCKLSVCFCMQACSPECMCALSKRVCLSGVDS